MRWNRRSNVLEDLDGVVGFQSTYLDTCREIDTRGREFPVLIDRRRAADSAFPRRPKKTLTRAGALVSVVSKGGLELRYEEVTSSVVG